jgi:hypothetical protein
LHIWLVGLTDTIPDEILSILSRRPIMIKSKKKLQVARETLLTLSKAKLEVVAGGFVTVAGAKCEPSGIIACHNG